MIYIISTLKTESGRTLYYRAFDTQSDSVMLVSSEKLKNIIEYTKIQVVNAKIENYDIVITNWSREAHTESRAFENNKVIYKHCGAKYIALTTEFNKYKVIDYAGNVFTLLKSDIRDLVKLGEIANIGISNHEEGDNMQTQDIHEIQKDEEFERLIASKYNNFIAKTIILGYGDISFKYTLENHEVKLSRYVGSSKNIILPPFITSIASNAFNSKGIESIKLNNGLRVIGVKAFSNGLINHVEIPESVELIAVGAFGHNKKLFKSNDHINTDRFKLQNRKTIVMDQAI